MTRSLSAAHECVWQGGEQTAAVVLRGPGEPVRLSRGEALCLAAELETTWPELARRLSEAADDVAHFTRFDGPLGSCEELEPQPGCLEKARQMIATAQATG